MMLLTTEKPVIINKPEDKFETMLFLPPNPDRKGEGGLRTKGYFKHSYKFVKGETLEVKGEMSHLSRLTSHVSPLTNTWCICDTEGNPVKPAPEDIQKKIWDYVNSKTLEVKGKTLDVSPSLSPSLSHLKLNIEPIKELPLITVITVVFNGEKHLEQTIQSVINQTYPNVEYIIIDGGSSDGTLDIIRKYEDYIDYWVSEKDKGIYDAMNKGIELTTGKWINFMNVGDGFYAEYVLNKIFSQNELKNLDVVYGNHNVIYPHKTRIAKAGNIENIWKGSQFCHQACFVSSTVHKENKFNLSNRMGADFEFFYTLYKKNMKFKNIDIVVANYSAGGLSDIKRIDSIVGRWNVIEKNNRKNLYYIWIILKEILKNWVKRVK